MKLLLDTHAFLWLVEGSPKLGATAVAALADPVNELFLSVASVWELAIKIRLAWRGNRLVKPSRQGRSAACQKPGKHIGLVLNASRHRRGWRLLRPARSGGRIHVLNASWHRRG